MSKKQIAVSVRDIHKEFILPQSKNTSFKQAAVNIVKKNNKVTQKVLDGISFDVNKGDFFGVVGRNGSGKSTLLKLLAGVYTPTSGEIIVNGGLTPFIELGVGFNPELSGRDNVYLNGALLGYNRKQMSEMYDEIVDFAELGPFMDQKLKNYSSGMQVRLAFSIAIKAKNEILIFDEVLAVGDEAFQRKCLDVFERYKAEGQTVILVTHDMETVRKYCNRAILISEGKLALVGNPQEVADEYSRRNQSQVDGETKSRNLAGRSEFIVKTLSDERKEKQSFDTGEKMFLSVSWPELPSLYSITVDIFKQSGEHISGFKTAKDGIEKLPEKGEAEVSVKLDIAPGTYAFQVSFRTNKDDEISTIYEVGKFSVLKNWQQAGRAWSGLVPIDHEWNRIE